MTTRRSTRAFERQMTTLDWEREVWRINGEMKAFRARRTAAAQPDPAKPARIFFGVDPASPEGDTTVYVMPIPPGMVPKGNFWDSGGASFRAQPDDSVRGWHWHPCNSKAKQQGKPDGDLVPYWPIVDRLTPR